MNNKGFSLIELIVAISIFVIITTVVVVNLKGGSPSQEVLLQSKNLDSLLRQAQMQSFAGEPFEGVFPIGGYGVLVSTCSAPPCSVTMFADFNTNFVFDANEEVKTEILGSNVTVESISTGNSLHVIFKPPRPFTCFDNVCSGIDTATITLGSTETTKTAEVVIDQVSGLVSSQ